MAIGTPSLATKGSSTGEVNSYTTASVSFVSGRYYELAFAIGRTGAVPDNPTVSGTTSGTWTSINGNIFDPAAAAQRARVGGRYYQATSTFSETLTIATTNACNGALWIVTEWTGVDSVTPIVQNANGRADAGTTASVTLAAFGSASNAGVGIFACDTASNVFTAGGTYTLLDQISRTDVNYTLCVVYKLGDEDPSATMASADWGGAGWELAAAAAAGGGVPRAMDSYRRRRVS